MNQIQFFYDDELILLQEKINSWLSENKDIEIVATDLNSIGKPSTRAGIVRTEKYVFFIMYRRKSEEVKASIANTAAESSPMQTEN